MKIVWKQVCLTVAVFFVKSFLGKKDGDCIYLDTKEAEELQVVCCFFPPHSPQVSKNIGYLGHMQALSNGI